MTIDSIVNGVVIDHIKAGKSSEIYDFLNLDSLDCQVAIIKNAPSKKMGKKDIIKIDRNIEYNLEILGYIDPDITVNIIKEGKLEKKMHLELPETITDVIQCKNPRCITSVEQGIHHMFKLTDRQNRIYRCMYCEAKSN